MLALWKRHADFHSVKLQIDNEKLISVGNTLVGTQLFAKTLLIEMQQEFESYQRDEKNIAEHMGQTILQYLKLIKQLSKSLKLKQKLFRQQVKIKMAIKQAA